MKTPAVTEIPAWLREMPGAGARAELDIEGFLPRPFAAYCLIFNPARSVAGEGLLWRDVHEMLARSMARRSGRTFTTPPSGMKPCIWIR